MFQHMNPKNWLYILPATFVIIFLIGALPGYLDEKKTSFEINDEVLPVNNSTNVKSEVNSAPNSERKERSPINQKITIDTTAGKNDTVWKAFRRKPSTKAWKAFFDIKYEHKGAYGYYPKFTAKHWQFHNKVIELNGYMYPLTEAKNQTFFMLSFYPLKQCFFCGGAGPESIVEVNSPKGIRLSSKRIKVKGKLTLNTKIPERLFYILDNATIAN